MFIATTRIKSGKLRQERHVYNPTTRNQEPGCAGWLPSEGSAAWLTRMSTSCLLFNGTSFGDRHAAPSGAGPGSLGRGCYRHGAPLGLERSRFGDHSPRMNL